MSKSTCEDMPVGKVRLGSRKELELLKQYISPNSIYINIIEKKSFTDTGKFITRLLLNMYGVDGLAVEWFFILNVLKTEHWKRWLWDFICQENMSIIPIGKVPIGKVVVEKKILLLPVKNLIFIQSEEYLQDIFQKEPELYYMFLRMRIALS